MASSSSALKKGYLIAYNSASAIAWTTILGRVVAVLLLKGPHMVPLAVDNFARITQTFATLEILHSVLGIVPSPLFTTLMQVASRLFLMWLVTYPFPSVTTSPAYSSMLCAWSLTELIRYGYFTAKLTGGDASPPPYWLHWLRYSAFIVLYPVGISSELVEVYLAATGPARGLAWWAPYALAAAAAVYAPGAPKLYTYMVKQRRKQLGGSVAKKEQ
ncbi:tyrosine phosphatase-like protein [Phialemonium atrogriseum]|uniref:Very-long-chain (3R)-3-hydroxyacyl-CoA dehydratase n=1 Tax=Phialemonium atrogriseum TaxID=1093897 RepID=A0AAJ0FEN4_9PEZI|nr:tyrosine phosphatase-like protein [Phialemonium atrogriseum]KAK1765761.1 tyrosine phosphatase-like protein [Phialemonium atrogriseum]